MEPTEKPKVEFDAVRRAEFEASRYTKFMVMGPFERFQASGPRQHSCSLLDTSRFDVDRW
jgi:hypothetical protein